MPLVLAIESSCDETSAAVVRDGYLLSSVVSSQIHIHSAYGGVVPELAVREHLRNLPVVIKQALGDAGINTRQLDAIAATQGPGLPTALMAGLKTAQGLAFALAKPFLGIHHHEAHLYSPWINGAPLRAQFERFQPNVALIASGGHTLLVHVAAELKHRVLGATVDDAAGECFDKTAKLAGLPYPGGPEIDSLSVHGNSQAFNFPRPMLQDDNDDFSFSGLKTAVRYFLDKHPEILEAKQSLCDLCACVQAAIVDTLVGKTLRVAKRLKVSCITASGGVTCNRKLRSVLAAVCAQNQIELRLANHQMCTDNAGMVGILAERKLLSTNELTPLDADIIPSWDLV